MNTRYCSPKIRRSPLSYCAVFLITLFLTIGCVNPAIYIKTTTETETASAALIEMAQDPEYQAQVLQMEAEFAVASWEALQLGESPV